MNTPVPKVRTFSRDAQVAQGASSAPQSAPVAMSVPARTAEPKNIPGLSPRPDLPQQESHLSDAHRVFDIRHASEGTEEGVIVKDTKRNRWSLGREIGKSLGAWAHNTAESLSTDEGPTISVAPAATRANIITKAGTPSHIAPADDHPAVVQKMRTFAQDAERATGKPFRLKTDIPEEPAQWSSVSAKKELFQQGPSSFEESAKKIFKSLKQPRPTAVLQNRANVIAKTGDLAVAPQARQTLPEKLFADSVSAGIQSEHIVPMPAPVEVAPLPQRAEKAPAPHQEEVIESPAEREDVAPSRDISFTLPTYSRQETSTYRTLRNDAIANVEEKQMSVASIAAKEATRRGKQGRDIDLRPKSAFMPLLGGAIGVFLLIVIGTGLYLQFKPAPEIQETIIRIPSPARTTTQVPIPLLSDRAQFLSTARDTMQSVTGSGLIQLYPTIDSEGTPAQTSMVMDVLNIKAPGSFIRSLDADMMLGTHIDNGRAPFMILKPRQFDVAFAGMLAWEEYMSSDLSPLFGEPVRRTLDPTARTNDQTRTARFVDATIQNRDVRILFDDLGEERLVYSFTDQGTIVVTTNTTTFGAILSALP